jgi:hypothetical protein
MVWYIVQCARKSDVYMFKILMTKIQRIDLLGDLKFINCWRVLTSIHKVQCSLEIVAPLLLR